MHRIRDRELRRLLRQAVQLGLFSWPDTSRVLRALHGLTQVEFAQKVRLSRRVIQMIEGGREREVAPSALERIARLARVPVGSVATNVTVELGTREIVKARELERARDLRAVRLGKMTLEELHARNALDMRGVRIGLPRLR